MARSGRHGDKCVKVIFKGIPLIDNKALSLYKLKAFKFVTSMAVSSYTSDKLGPNRTSALMS